jgi:chromosome segregation ATPase
MSLLERVIDNKNKKIYKINTYLQQIEELTKIENQLGGMTPDEAQRLRDETHAKLTSFTERTNAHNQMTQEINRLVESLVGRIPTHLREVADIIKKLQDEHSEKHGNLKDELDNCRRQLAEERHARAAAEAQVQEAHRAFDELHKEALKITDELEKDKTEHKLTQQQKAELEEEHRRLEDIQNKIKSDHEAAKEKNQQHETNITNLERQISELRTELDNSKKTNEDYKKSLEILKHTIDELNNHLDDSARVHSRITELGNKTIDTLRRAPDLTTTARPT